MDSNRALPFVSGRDAGSRMPERRRNAHKTDALLRAIEQTADTVFITDRDGRIIYVNPAFEALTGFSAAEAIGETPRLFSSGRQDAHFYQNLWTTILSGQVFRFVLTNKAKDGRLYEEDQTITPIRDASGHISHFVSTGRDITRRRRAEEALRRLNSQLELESARIAGVLHDEAGQFLASAHITIADVSREVPPSLQAKLQQVRRHLDQVEEQLRRVAHELHPSILADLGLLDAIKSIVNSFARRTGIRVTIDADLGHSWASPVATVVYRFAQEALTNMGKHSRASTGTIVLRREGPLLRCAIRDNGVGFDPAEVLARGGRLGIGLKLIQDRLEAVGGDLQIVSSPGQGTELLMTVPAPG
jgi:two-component system, NarL family, sensor histidine kinase NreB